MPLITTYGIVLRYANFSETSRMVTLFTPGYGKLSVSAKGCRKPKSPLFSGCELYTFGQYVLHENRGSYTMTQADVVEAYYDLRSDLDVLTCASQMRDVVEVVSTEGQQRASLFILMARCLEALCKKDANPWMLSLFFQMQALRLEGLFPQIDICTECKLPLEDTLWYSASAGGALCTGCSMKYDDARRVLPGTISSMRLMATADLANVRVLRLGKQVQPELEAIWKDTLVYQLEKNFGSMDFSHKLQNHVYHTDARSHPKKDK